MVFSSIRTYRILVSAVEVVPCPRNNHLENQIEPIDAKRPSMPMWVVTYLCLCRNRMPIDM